MLVNTKFLKWINCSDCVGKILIHMLTAVIMQTGGSTISFKKHKIIKNILTIKL